MWCPGPRGQCRWQGDVGAALVPCQAAGMAVAAGASCCPLLHPTLPLQCPGGSGQSPVRVGGPEGATSPAHPALHFTWGLLTVGTHHSTSCSGAFRDSSPWLSPSPNHPLPERKPWGSKHGRAGRGWQPLSPHNMICRAPGRDPAPYKRHRYLGAAPIPPPHSSPTSQQLSSSHALRDAQRGRLSPRVHNISHAWTDRQTETPSPWCPPLARHQLLPPACGHRQWVFIHK